MHTTHQTHNLHERFNECLEAYPSGMCAHSTSPRGGVALYGKPQSRPSASQWQSIGREYTSTIPWNIRNAVR
eukprot:3607097-Pyramimonas_sp.AAC.1